MSNESRSLIVYQPPSILTFTELLITEEALRRGDRVRAGEIAWIALGRSFGIPQKIVYAGDCNYSSARMDLQIFRNKGTT